LITTGTFLRRSKRRFFIKTGEWINRILLSEDGNDMEHANTRKEFNEWCANRDKEGGMPFDEEGEKELNIWRADREANTKKIRVAQANVETGLGPSKLDTRPSSIVKRFPSRLGTKAKNKPQARAGQSPVNAQARCLGLRGLSGSESHTGAASSWSWKRRGRRTTEGRRAGKSLMN
jgi:hypothetical protein